MAAVTICSDFGVQENKVSHCFHCFTIYLPWSDGTRWHYLILIYNWSLKSKRIPEKHLLLLYWLCQSLWKCRSQQTVENSSRDGNTKPPNLPPRNLYAGQEATVRTGHGTTDQFQIGTGVGQDCILSPCLFNLYVEYVMPNTGLDEAQAGIKIARRNTNNLN